MDWLKLKKYVDRLYRQVEDIEAGLLKAEDAATDARQLAAYPTTEH